MLKPTRLIGIHSGRSAAAFRGALRESPPTVRDGRYRRAQTGSGSKVAPGASLRCTGWAVLGAPGRHCSPAAQDRDAGGEGCLGEGSAACGPPGLQCGQGSARRCRSRSCACAVAFAAPRRPGRPRAGRRGQLGSREPDSQHRVRVPGAAGVRPGEPGQLVRRPARVQRRQHGRSQPGILSRGQRRPVHRASDLAAGLAKSRLRSATSLVIAEGARSRPDGRDHGT
jgi:hypothetical protein